MNQHDPHMQRRTAHARSGATARRVPASSNAQAAESGIRSGPFELEPRTALEQPLTLTAQQEQRFHALYCEHFDFVLRNLKRLGVSPAAVDDALQEVYLVVLRRLRDLQHDAHLKAWLFAIIIRVAGNQRRSVRRRGTLEPLGERSIACVQPGPFDLTARAQAAEFLHDFLTSLGDNRRAVFVMAELEQLTAPEIAQALGANLNTVYSWLRAARIAFSKTFQVEPVFNEGEHD